MRHVPVIFLEVRLGYEIESPVMGYTVRNIFGFVTWFPVREYSDSLIPIALENVTEFLGFATAGGGYLIPYDDFLSWCLAYILYTPKRWFTYSGLGVWTSE